MPAKLEVGLAAGHEEQHNRPVPKEVRPAVAYGNKAHVWRSRACSGRRGRMDVRVVMRYVEAGTERYIPRRVHWHDIYPESAAYPPTISPSVSYNRSPHSSAKSRRAPLCFTPQRFLCSTQSSLSSVHRVCQSMPLHQDPGASNARISKSLNLKSSVGSNVRRHRV